MKNEQMKKANEQVVTFNLSKEIIDMLYAFQQKHDQETAIENASNEQLKEMKFGVLNASVDMYSREVRRIDRMIANKEPGTKEYNNLLESLDKIGDNVRWW